MIISNLSNSENEFPPWNLKRALGHKVEALAFGVTYVGVLKKIDLKSGTLRIEDRKDYVILEIESIRNFKILSVEPSSAHLKS